MSTYAMSDLHGQLDLFRQMADFIQPDDTVYCLGDCGDRGPEPWETIKAVAADPRFIYIMGNHEDMLVGAIQNELYLPIKTIYPYQDDMEVLLYINGGGRTLEQWRHEEGKVKWLTYLANLPLVKTYTNIQGQKMILSHAGPNALATDLNAYPPDVLWDRNNMAPFTEDIADDIVLVHGHTPIPYLTSEWDPTDGVLMYNKRKIDIDFGSVSTGSAVLLDLDTYDEHIFFVKKEG